MTLTTGFGSQKKSQSYRSRTPAGGHYQISWATLDNVPPWAVLDFAIEAHKASESIFLPITFREKSQKVSSYFVFYFALELFEPTRKIAIYIDSQEKNVTEIPNGPSMVSISPVNVTGGTANVTITSVDQGNNTSPPLLSAMEVFSTMSKISKAYMALWFYRLTSFCFVLLSFALRELELCAVQLKVYTLKALIRTELRTPHNTTTPPIP
ncbi:Malectin-like carbohydrate-binding domain containing protein [Trema orientale]|uniref:Malectin-like carbohydrate-binding domain containing protein n=1 Tax=Trema orientale TaxID=63057 RepID=A0A2P5ATL0_TREOI|nr:Malectin-like carbohydrate-binding domain containing protein [Trema orientale]